MAKDDRSKLNPFSQREDLDLINDDKFLKECYNEYYGLVNQWEILDDTPQGQIIINVARRLVTGVEEYLADIGRSDYTADYYDWEVHLVNNNTVNAFCIPGGKIVIFSGILQIADSEETIAFILGHEMAHALLDHSRTSMSKRNVKNGLTTAARIGGLGLSLFGFGELGWLALDAANIADVGSELFILQPHGRDQELEADQLGIRIINWAGYNIRGIPEFWQRMSNNSANNFDFFSTHPSDDKRIQAMREIIAKIENERGYLMDTTNTSSCPNCGSIINQNDLFCSNCGVKIEKKSKATKICLNCGANNNIDNNFCNNCGFNFYDEHKCSNCGSLIDKDSIFCSNCGAKID